MPKDGPGLNERDRSKRLRRRTIRRVLIGVALVLVLVLGLPVLRFWSMWLPRPTGFKHGFAQSSNGLIRYPPSAAPIDAYYESGGMDGTFYIRFRMSASDLNWFMAQKAFDRPWLTGKAFHTDLPWLMKWYWRDLWTAGEPDCHMWGGELKYHTGDGGTQDWPASVIIRPDRAGTMVVYFAYTTI
jgi:hypothetical protein